MAKRVALQLSNEELLELETISRSTKAERRMVERSKIILLWHQGKSFVETQHQHLLNEKGLLHKKQSYQNLGVIPCVARMGIYLNSFLHSWM